jgi:hypothetical protein
MKCFCPLNLKNWNIISNKTYEFILKTEILKNQWSWNSINLELFLKEVPELSDLFVNLNLQIKMAAIIYRKPFYQGGIHIDSGTEIRALIPIKNCEGSYTKFFEIDKNKIETIYGKSGDVFYHVPPAAVIKEIASIETIQPFIFNPQIPHGVFTNPKCKMPRLTLTVGFDRSPVELLS